MLIGWATPFNIRSAIGKFSRFVGEELHSRGHDVTIIRVETGPELALDPLQTDLPIVSADEVDVGEFDALVVNFGNHAPYHSQAVSLLARRPSLSIFHDAEMRDFEWGLRQRHGVVIPRLEGIGTSETDCSAADLVAPAAQPLLGALAAMSWGAVVHGPHYRNTVARHCPGPVEVIPLCYPDDGIIHEPAALSEGRRVIIFGVINDHKQPRRVLRALAQLKDRLGAVELHLAGAVEDRYRSDLVKEAATLGVDPPLFHGYVSDERLHALIEDSHVVCCLRYPVTEGGSASLVTALNRQRPLIISDIASYSMVPSDLASKVSYGEDVGDLAEALLTILQDQPAAEDRAREARLWASDRYSASSYVDALMPLLDSRAATETLAQLARDLVPAMTDSEGKPMMAVVQEIADVLDWMQGSQANLRSYA